MQINDTLFVIPARGGSKGLPRKNILPLLEKPLICYTIDAARGITEDENICVSTDDEEIKQVVEAYGLKVPFLRPPHLATNSASSRSVILHAFDYFKNHLNRNYSKICLLQPTSPLRKTEHIKHALGLWEENIDMVVSVKESKANPYFNLFEENISGFLTKSKQGDFVNRQDAPKIWEYNGAIYVINPDSIRNYAFADFEKIKKYRMNQESSIDIDTKLDWYIAEQLMMNKE